MTYANPKWAIVLFLRAHLTDPAARAETSNTETFDGDASTTSFNLSPPSGRAFTISSVSIGGVDQQAWTDYRFDYRSSNPSIIFNVAPPIGSSNVSVTYKHGSKSWIYPDKPISTINESSYPRVGIEIIGAPGSRIGNYETKLYRSLAFRVHVYTKERDSIQDYSSGGYSISGRELAEKIAADIIQAFEDYESDLHGILQNFRLTNGPLDQPFDSEREAFYESIDFSLDGFDPYQVI